MSVATHGSMVKEAWYGTIVGGPLTILVVEGIGDDICNDANPV